MTTAARSIPRLCLALALATCTTPPSTPAVDADQSATTTAPPSSSSTSTASDDTAATMTGDSEPCNDSPEALADCADAAAYHTDLEFVADVRVPGSAHWQGVQDLCADRLEQLGFTVQLYDYGTGVDVIGRRLGTTRPDELVIVSAHYDHLEGCHGADDNASGVAATLEIARVLALAEFERTLLVACWDEEEAGLVGSQAFIDAATSPPLDVAAVFNFDMIGYRSDAPNTQTVPMGFDLVFSDAYAAIEANEFRGDFIAVINNAKAHQAGVDFVAQAERIGLTAALVEIPDGSETSDLFAPLRRSDHAVFWDAGHPAVFLTDTADFRNAHYHCMGGPDDVIDIDEEFAVKVTRATIGAAALSLGLVAK